MSATTNISDPRSAAQRSAAWTWTNDLRPRAWTVVRMALGLLLVTAAALKLAGLNVTAIPRAGWFATPQVQVVAAEWELILGFWLLSGVYRFAAWLAALLTFITFAAISAYFGFIGIASCGCFGVIRTSPWTVFTIDIAAILLLLVSRPPAPTTTRLRFADARTSLRHSAIPLAAVTILLAITAIGSFVYGSPAAALAKLRGESLTVEPSYVDFGDGKPGDVLERTLTVYNWTNQPVRIVGGSLDCSIAFPSKLPMLIDSRGKATIRARMKVPFETTGVLTKQAFLWTDNASNMTLGVRGVVVVTQQAMAASLD